jgi:hypothetical protein
MGGSATVQPRPCIRTVVRVVAVYRCERHRAAPALYGRQVGVLQVDVERLVAGRVDKVLQGAADLGRLFVFVVGITGVGIVER